jgi:hypothetical protein
MMNAKRSGLVLAVALTALPVVALAQDLPEESYEFEGYDGYADDAPGYDDLPVEDPAQVPAPPPEAQGVTQATFEATLAPYGDWITVGSYGRVWRPHAHVVGANFRPYATGGRWEYTSHGWIWRSSYSWGWAPFHYGRWFHDAYAGWVWVPDTTWGPAWVDWRVGNGYVGWAPLAPRGWRAAASWYFVPAPYFRSPTLVRYIVPSHRHRHVYSVTTPFRRHVSWGARGWNAGPSVSYFRGWHRPAGGHRWVHRRYDARPTYSRPAYSRPAYSRPAYSRPAYQAPRHHGGYDRPRHQRPTYSRPVYQAPQQHRGYDRPRQDRPRQDRGGYERPRARGGEHRAPAYQGGGGHSRGPRYVIPERSGGNDRGRGDGRGRGRGGAEHRRFSTGR